MSGDIFSFRQNRLGIVLLPVPLPLGKGLAPPDTTCINSVNDCISVLHIVLLHAVSGESGLLSGRGGGGALDETLMK